MRNLFTAHFIACVALFSCLALHAHAQSTEDDYSVHFAEAYRLHPDLPKGVLESVAHSNTRMHHITHNAGTPESCTGMPKAYGVMGLVLDGKGYFKNNLALISNLTGVSADELIQNPREQILAYAAAFTRVREEHYPLAKDIDALAATLTTLSELPHETEAQTFALSQQLYSYLTFLNEPKFGEQYHFPNYNLDLHTFFGEENFKVLSAPHVIVGDEVYDMFGNDFDGGYQRGGMSADYPPALWNAAASCNYSTSRGAAVSAVVIHDVEGSYAGCISWFKNCSSGVSAHYVIRSSDGQITQMVLEQHRAWHVGSHNPYTIGIEHEGYQAQQGWYTTAMYAASANLVKDICSSGYGISPTTCYNGPSCNDICTISTSYKIKGHQHYSGQTHNDPGPYWNWGTYYSLINNTPPPTPPANDNCSAAITLTANTSCVATAGTLANATSGGLAKATCDVSTTSSLKDVWYKFTASATSHTITLAPSSGLDAVLALYTSCTTGQIACSDNGGGRGGTETILKSGLTVGTTYYLRIYPYGATAPSTWTFNICITKPAVTPSILTIGSGTSAYSAHPYSTVYMDERTEYIITKAELVAAGWTASKPAITALAFQVNTAASQAMNGFTIALAHTSTSIFSSTAFLAGTNSTTVYTGTVTANAGWNTYSFSTPFTYNGVDNLLIKICWNNSTYSANSSILATSYPTYVALYYRADLASGGVCAQAGGTQSYYRPNTRVTCSAGASSFQPDNHAGENEVTGLIESSVTPNSFIVYPNPFDGDVLHGKIAESNNEIILQLFEVSGKRITEKSSEIKNGEFTVSFTENYLQPGVYLLVAVVGDKKYTSRIVVR